MLDESAKIMYDKSGCDQVLNLLLSNSETFSESGDTTGDEGDDERSVGDVFLVSNNASSAVSQKLISKSIELLVEKLDLSYSDAILQVVEYFEIQLSDLKKMLAPQIVEKLYGEAVKLHLVKDDSKIEALF